jgi:hypothetical protein
VGSEALELKYRGITSILEQHAELKFLFTAFDITGRTPDISKGLVRTSIKLPVLFPGRKVRVPRPTVG